MPKTPIKYTIQADGSTDIFSIPWPYIDKSYVKVYLNDLDISDTVTWLSPNTVKVYPLPLLHQTVTITRDTPSDKPLVKFKDGSRLEDADIKRGMAQSLHVMEEVLDEMNHATADLITDSAEAKEAAQSALNSAASAALSSVRSQEFMSRSESAADRAEAAIGGQYPDVELNVVTEIVEDSESLAGSYDPETGTLTFKIPESMKLESGGGSGGNIELTDRVDLSFSTIAASSKAVKLAYDTAVAARPPLGSPTVTGIVRLATPEEHLQKASGVAAQPSEIGKMIEAAMSETSLSTPDQDGLIGRGGDYGELWTRLSEHVYGWEPVAEMMKDTGLVTRAGSQLEVSKGEVDPASSPLRPPYVGPVEHAKSHRITQHLYLESDVWVPDADGYVCGLILISGGQAGGNSSYNGSEGRRYGGHGGAGGRIHISPQYYVVNKGQAYPVIIGAGGASNGAEGGVTSFRGIQTSAANVRISSGGVRGESASGSTVQATAGGAWASPWLWPGAVGGAGASNGNSNYAGGGGGGAGVYLPFTNTTTPFSTATNGGGGATRQGVAGTGIGAGGGGAGIDGQTAQTGGRGAQGAVLFVFIRHPGGL